MVSWVYVVGVVVEEVVKFLWCVCWGFGAVVGLWVLEEFDCDVFEDPVFGLLCCWEV